MHVVVTLRCPVVCLRCVLRFIAPRFVTVCCSFAFGYVYGCVYVCALPRIRATVPQLFADSLQLVCCVLITLFCGYPQLVDYLFCRLRLRLIIPVLICAFTGYTPFSRLVCSYYVTFTRVTRCTFVVILLLPILLR